MKNYMLTLTALVFSMHCNGQTFGDAILLDGQNDFITVPNNSNLNQTQAISIEAWIRPCDITDGQTIVSKNWCNGNQNAYSFHVRPGGILDWVWDTDGCGNGAHQYTSDNAIIQPNVWQHVAVVHTASSVALYLNGQLVDGSLANGSYSDIQVSNEPLRIGAYRFLSGSFGFFYNGLMDEVRIWNYAVSSANISSRFNAELSGNESGLVAYYNMNTISGNGTGITVVNNAAIGSPLDGTTVGTTSSPLAVSFNTIANICSGCIIEANAGSDVTVYPGVIVPNLPNGCTNPPSNLNFGCTDLTATSTGAQGTISYLWSTGETTQTINVCPLVTTTYTVTITDASGCSSTDEVTVNTCDITTNGGAKVKVFTNGGAQATVSINSLGAHLCNGGSLDLSGCNDSGARMASLVTVNTIALNSTVYPNPSSGKITVLLNEFDNNSDINIDVINSQGVIVESKQVTNQNTGIDLSSHSKGIYLVRVSDGTTAKVQKVIFE